RQIKRANGLRSNLIRAGSRLIIPIRTHRVPSINRSAFKILPLQTDVQYATIHSEKPLEKIWLLAHKGADKYPLNGVVLERDTSGLIYSGIGVNGARFQDYN